MKRFPVLGIILAIWVVVFAGPGRVVAQTRSLTPGEQVALDTCLTIIRGCQLPDGAITMLNLGTTPETQVWIAPWFGNFGALALVANHQRNPGAGDLQRVRLWIDWCCAHQEPEGIWLDYVGTRASYQTNNHVDAYDSSAASFLWLLGRYKAAGGTVTPEMQTAALKSFACLKGLTDPKDGLLWGRPDYPVKLFMDNVEVRAGLNAAAYYFQTIGLEEEASDAAGRASFMKASLESYWHASRGAYAWAQYLNGSQSVENAPERATEVYPKGLAQIWGISFLTPHPAAWQTALTFEPDHTYNGNGVEWFTIAASRIGGQDELTWRAALVDEVETFVEIDALVFRAGLAALALMEGADWLPGPAVPAPTVEPTTTSTVIVTGVVGEVLFRKFSPRNLYVGETPRQVTFVEAGGPLPSGLTFHVEQETESRSSLALGGIPLTAGVSTCTIQYHEGGMTLDRPLRFHIFADAEHRDAYDYYCELRDASGAPDFFYWEALAGYVLGMGVGDEGSALYSYYTSLGDYYYVAHAATSPSAARYYYYYYRGLGAYYFYERRGEAVNAQLAFTYFVGLAIAAW